MSTEVFCPVPPPSNTVCDRLLASKNHGPRPVEEQRNERTKERKMKEGGWPVGADVIDIVDLAS